MIQGMPPLTANEFKVMREAHGLTQTELAERMGVTLRAVQYWEAGTRKVSNAMSILGRQVCARIRSSNRGNDDGHDNGAPTVGVGNRGGNQAAGKQTAAHAQTGARGDSRKRKSNGAGLAVDYDMGIDPDAEFED